MKILNTSQKVNLRQGSGSLHKGFRYILKATLMLALSAGLLNSQDALAQYVSSNAVQDTVGTFPGMIRSVILEVQVVTSGSASSVTSMTFNTNGTGNAANITSASLYYNNSGNFNTALLPSQQVGSSISTPNGTFTFTGFNQNLASGTNRFWLTYDISPNSTLLDSVDAELTSLDVDAVTQTPTVSAPAGSRKVRSNITYNYCQLGAPGLNYAIGINTFRIADTVIRPTIIGSFTVTKFPAVVRLARGLDYPFSYRNGTFQPGYSYEKIYIDIDNDGFFDNTNEILFSGTTLVSDSSIGILIVPCSTALGTHRIRIMTDYYTGSGACNTGLGNAYDFVIDVKDPFVYSPPTANFTKQDTAFVGQFVKFTNTSVGIGYGYSWDFKNAGGGNVDATTKNGSYQFTAGNYITKLRMARMTCGSPQADSISKSIVIIMPSARPVSEFISDRNITSSAIVVNLMDISTWGANKWHWKISPATLNGNPAYVYVNGTDSTSQNPQVRFLELGVFSVYMSSENVLGYGTLVSKVNYITNIGVISMCASLKTNEAAGFLADEGGAAAPYTTYATGKTCSFLIQPCASSVTFNFIDFDLNSYGSTGCATLPGENLKIFDGPDASGFPLHVAAGFPGGFTNGPNNGPLPSLPPSVTASSGSMYVEFFMNCTGVGRGFFGEWKSVPANVSAPIPSFSSTDTAFTNVPYIFTNTTKGVADKYYWDFNNDGALDAISKDADITFATAGNQTVKLTVERCGSLVSFTKTIFVKTTTAAPVAGFIATRTSAVVNDTLRLLDESLNGPTAYTWTITPSVGWSFVNSSTASSRNPFVVFNQIGTFTVKLKVTNSLGIDSITKSSYISIFSYCSPNVINLSNDIGISKLVFGTINNSSSIGTAAYTRYNMSTSVERGASYGITIERNTNFNNVNRKVWIDFNRNGSFGDAGDEVLVGGSSNSLVFAGQITIPKTAPLGIARMRVGISSENNSNNPCGPNAFGEFEDYNIDIIDDVTKPVITLIGSNPLNIEQSVPFTDPGATAMDNSDGNITHLIVVNSNIDTSKVGLYRIVYRVTDLSGNQADSVIRLVVVYPDRSGPVVTLIGGDVINHTVNTTFTDPGATALDYVDGNMTSSITVTGTVDSSVLGTYYLTYNAVDLNGNAGTKVRIVNVVDDVAPVIVLNGADPLVVNFGSTFVDPGTTVTDNFYSGVVSTSSGNVNTNLLGTYIVTYNAKDPSGNSAIPVTRTVNVVDISAPVITLFGADTIILDVKTPYFEPGSDVKDNHTQGLTAVITGTVIDTIIGNYPLTYTATDSSGNIATRNRLVRVVDRFKPVITLNGSAFTVIRRWDHYFDASAFINDNYYTNVQLQGLMTVTNGLDANNEGLYQICFNVTDPSGNIADQVCRLVSVTSANSIQEASLEESVGIYPNPNNGLFTIGVSYEKDMKIEIYNSYGSLVKALDKNAAAGNTFEVDLTTEAAGIYFVRISSGDQTITRRISYQR